jgi:hypothetical protein
MDWDAPPLDTGFLAFVEGPGVASGVEEARRVRVGERRGFADVYTVSRGEDGSG